MRRLAYLVPLLLSTGCLGNGEEDPKAPGDQLGSFLVSALMDDSTCGEGALGSPDKWEFSVKLSKDGDALYWLNGKEAIVGDLEADGVSFNFDTHIVIPAIPPGKGQIGCNMSRSDKARGKLSNADDATEFAGDLDYEFTPSVESDCSPLIGVEGGFAMLPCAMHYEMTASRTEAPESL